MTESKQDKEKKIEAKLKTVVPAKLQVIPGGYKIKAKGIYNIEDLYQEMQLWFQHMGYKWREVEYRYTIGRDGNKVIEFVWIGEKNPSSHKYSTYYISIGLQAVGSDVDVTLDTGAKVKRFKGSLEFRTEAYIQRNVDLFINTPFPSLMLKVYEILTRDRLKAEWDELFTEANKLYDELKAFLIIYR